MCDVGAKLDPEFGAWTWGRIDDPLHQPVYVRTCILLTHCPFLELGYIAR